MVGGCGHTHAAGLMGMAVEAAVLEVGIHCADGWNGGVVTGILFGGRGGCKCACSHSLGVKNTVDWFCTSFLFNSTTNVVLFS